MEKTRSSISRISKCKAVCARRKKFYAQFTTWETGHHLGNEFNTSKPENLFSPPFIFTNEPAYRQLQMSTIRSLSEDLQRSNEYIRLIQTFGVDTLLRFKKDTILPFEIERIDRGNGRIDRRITPLVPKLQR